MRMLRTCHAHAMQVLCTRHAHAMHTPLREKRLSLCCLRRIWSVARDTGWPRPASMASSRLCISSAWLGVG